MRVIFIKDLKKQGKKGEIKEVKDGYAKNFLIKNGYAVLETPTSVTILSKDKAEEAELIRKEKENANKLKKVLENITLTFEVKTGNEDKVFGSISSKQISDELLKNNIVIDKKKIKIKESLQTLGTHVVEIELYNKIIAQVKVQLISR